MRILVRGVNDVGSAVAHQLFTAGHTVVLHDGLQPTTTRRRMAFSDAIFDGRAVLEGLEAVRVDQLAALPALLERRNVIPVLALDFDTVLGALTPSVLVDARMRKRAQPESQRSLAPLTIGLGPGFVAGQNVDLAIETSWEAPGRVIEQGPTLDLAGEPRAIDGHARERYLYAPLGGIFKTGHQVGDLVAAGEVVARIETADLRAPLAGVLRGLTHDGVPVAPRTKVVEVDPRGAGTSVAGLGERPARIAAGVLLAIQRSAVAVRAG